MSCSACHYNKGILQEKVACGSMKHAKFMDTHDTERYQTMIRKLGAMPLVTTEALGMDCPDYVVKR